MESLSDIETSNFKALLIYHFLSDIRFTPAMYVKPSSPIQKAQSEI